MKSYAQRMKKPQIENLQQSTAMGASIGNQAMGALMGYDASKSKSDPALEDKMRAKLQKQFSFPKQEAHREPGGVPLPPAIQKEYEEKSGVPLDDVMVHYNSDMPQKLDALAYAYGSEIYISDGRKQLLGHELSHVIQQKLGLVQPMSSDNGLPLNTSESLERDANKSHSCHNRVNHKVPRPVAQRYTDDQTLIENQNDTITKKDIIDFINYHTTFSDDKKKWFLENIDNITFVSNPDVGDKEAEKFDFTPKYKEERNINESEIGCITFSKLFDLSAIPNIQDDYDKFIKEHSKSGMTSNRYYTLVSFVHELGHAYQSEKENLGGSLGDVWYEYHNFITNENSVCGRKRLAYENMDDEKFNSSKQIIKDVSDTSDICKLIEATLSSGDQVAYSDEKTMDKPRDRASGQQGRIYQYYEIRKRLKDDSDATTILRNLLLSIIQYSTNDAKTVQSTLDKLKKQKAQGKKFVNVSGEGGPPPPPPPPPGKISTPVPGIFKKG